MHDIQKEMTNVPQLCLRNMYNLMKTVLHLNAVSQFSIHTIQTITPYHCIHSCNSLTVFKARLIRKRR